MKKLKSIGVVVFAQTGSSSKDWSRLPAVVKTFTQKTSDSIPYVVFTTPDLSKSFGGFTHKKLKSGNYTDLFRDTKSKIREAKGLGELDKVGDLIPEKETKKSGKKSNKKTSKEDVDSNTDSGLVEITDSVIDEWTSSNYKKIDAKLISVENGSDCIFETSAGKKINVKTDQLSEASIGKVNDLVNANR